MSKFWFFFKGFRGGPVFKTPPFTESAGLILGWGVKIPYAPCAIYGNMKQKLYLYKFDKTSEVSHNQKKKLFKIIIVF